MPRLEGALARALPPEVRAPARERFIQTACSVELKDWVRDPLERLTEGDHSVDGLNCWGSVLFLRGLRERLFYAHDREFSFVMEQACRIVRDPKAGDIGAIRRRYETGLVEEVHAFLYLTEDYAISKHSYSFASELEITAPEKFFSVYGRDVTYYRCDGWREPEVPAELNLLVNQLERDYLQGTILKGPRAGRFYLPLIERLNKYYFVINPADRDYGFQLFESAVWQYTYLYTGVRTPQEPIEL